MAVFKDGIMGSFKGRVGNVVGYEWRGLSVMRSRPRIKKNRKPTEKQLANRARFNLMQEYLRFRIGFVRKGFSLAPELQRMSQFNVAMSYNLSNAIAGEYPNWYIDYSKVVFSKGDLELPKGISLALEKDILRVSWDTEKEGAAADDDQAMVMVSGSNDVIGKHSGSLREDGEELINLVGEEEGTELFVHIAFISDDRSRVSDSLYLGSVVVGQ